MRTLCTTSLLALLAALGQAPAAAQGVRTAFSLGAGLHPLGSAAPILQAEYLLTERVSLGARFIGLDYSYEDGSYTESGNGRGAELLVNFHMRGIGFEGPYLGGGLGYFTADWDWYSPNERARSGFGRTRGAQVSTSVGWKWPLGRSLYLDPALTVGHFFGTAKDNTGTRESELGTYGALTVKLGWRF